MIGSLELGKQIAGIVAGAFQKFLPNAQSAISQKMQDSNKPILQTLGEILETPEMIKEIQESAQKHEDFMTQYEGSMSELTEWGKNLRASVRPVLTYAFSGIYIFLILYGIAIGLGGWPTSHLEAALAITDKLSFKMLTFVIIFWWFGDRAVQSWLGKIR